MNFAAKAQTSMHGSKAGVERTSRDVPRGAKRTRHDTDTERPLIKSEQQITTSSEVENPKRGARIASCPD